MVKIWGSSKNDRNWTAGKVLKLSKFIFTILHLVVVVVVVVAVVLLLQINNQTELRDETLRTDRYP